MLLDPSIPRSASFCASPPVWSDVAGGAGASLKDWLGVKAGSISERPDSTVGGEDEAVGAKILARCFAPLARRMMQKHIKSTQSKMPESEA
jgi:hypothetical protein